MSNRNQLENLLNENEIAIPELEDSNDIVKFWTLNSLLPPHLQYSLTPISAFSPRSTLFSLVSLIPLFFGHHGPPNLKN